MSKKQVMAEIIRHTSLSDGIFDMTLKAEEIAKEAKAGQFISVYLNNKSKILPRPISICGIDKEAGTLRIVYRTVGDGTKELSDYKEGEMVKILGPLGNGFTQKDKKAILIGGGIGIPPMLELMKQLDCDKTAVLGYRDSDMFLKDEFEAVGDVVISTEDGSFGTKGNVIDAIKEQGVEGSIIYACGPTPMLRGIKAYAEEMGIEVTATAKDGREVIQEVRKDKPDVILMDVRMPEMDGVQCTQIIKEQYPDVKIIILTTFDDDEYVYNALKHGASGYLLKGISMDELEKAINTVHSGGAMINPEVATKVVDFFSEMAQSNYDTSIHAQNVEEITDAEWEIIKLVGRGMSNKEISTELSLSEGTVRNYLSTILSKLDLRDRTQLAIWEVQSGSAKYGRR